MSATTHRQYEGTRLLASLALLGGIVGLPLLGAALVGRDLRDFFVFPPPLAIPTDYPRFSWLAASAVVSTLAVVLFTWRGGGRSAGAPRQVAPAAREPASRLAWWGWLALGWTLTWWALAWTRWDWFSALQRYTFFPLWLGFIVSVNALTQRRVGTCLMLHSPRIWWALFAASAVFWWMFEWLNRFVRNWHYLAVEDFGPLSYALHATLCFSTVLPAVAAVAEWLGSHPGWNRRVVAGPAWGWLGSTRVALALTAAAAAALVLTGAYPQWFYPALWLAPLVLLLAEPVLVGDHGIAHELARGEWRRPATWMIAALACGFSWELWNSHSLAKWIYTVPGVERWFVFEMPLLGYAGYLPFGLECLLVVDRLITRPRQTSTAHFD